MISRTLKMACIYFLMALPLFVHTHEGCGHHHAIPTYSTYRQMVGAAALIAGLAGFLYILHLNFSAESEDACSHSRHTLDELVVI